MATTPLHVTLIGASGFIGRRVQAALASVSSTLANRPPISLTLASRHPSSADKQNLALDLSNDPRTVQDTLSAHLAQHQGTQRHHVVVNLVGIMAGDFDAVQHRGAHAVAQACRAGSTRLVHVSAIGADAQSEIAYARSKGLGEQAVLKALGNRATVVRPSLVFGPEDDFFNRFAKLSKYLPVMPVFGGGTTRFQPVYVDDLAEVVVRTCLPAHAPAVAGKVVEVGGPSDASAVYTYRELMQLVLQASGRKRPIVSLPWAVGMLQGAVLERLPPNLFTLTVDQVRLLKRDNVAGNTADPNVVGVGAVQMESAAFVDPKDVLHKWLK
ncbi:pantoate-beta-alanine ligase [Sorochytrium milnesiophthora]